MSKSKVLFLFLPLLLVSCYSSRTGRDRERTYNKPYHRPDNELAANMFLYHGTHNTSFIYYKINNSQLIYKKSDTSNYFAATLKFFYRSLPYPEATQILDSATVLITDKTIEQGAARDLVGYIPLKVNDGDDCYIEVYVEDLLSHKSHKHYIHCDKRGAFSQQNFLIETPNKDVIFSNKIVKGAAIQLVNNRAEKKSGRVDYFKVDYSLPPPPFSDREPQLFPSVPDSSFMIDSEDSHTFPFRVAKQGIYYVRLDTSAGCTILGVESNFPKVQSHAQMIAASRFIMNKEEYQKLVEAQDKQAAIEAFWLSVAGSEDRAKELIKRYYNRVQDANSFFTSHIEGWKTDMGMIYIIFGTPSKTYKTEGMETWEYYMNNAPSLIYRFEKIRNPFSENCYKLRRSINYKDPWTIAVSYWREGRVYLED